MEDRDAHSRATGKALLYLVREHQHRAFEGAN